MGFWRTVMLLAFVIDGCGGDPCDGERPALTDCELGLFRADCGGRGPVTLACSPTISSCRWFATSCIAREFVASDCPYGDPCCHSVPGGTWPFSDDWSRASDPAGIVEDIAACGDEPVTDDRPTPITVSVDPTIVSTLPSRVSCMGMSFNFCESTDFVPRASGENSVVLRLVGTAAINPEIVMLEIVHLDADHLAARAFVRVSAEAANAVCEYARTPRRRLIGSVTLSSGDLSSPTTLHGRADLVLVGATATVLF